MTRIPNKNISKMVGRYRMGTLHHSLDITTKNSFASLWHLFLQILKTLPYSPEDD